MVFRNWLLAVIAGIVLLVPSQFGFAETTTIKVPQGTGVFPTIGQIKCLEELGSGRFCAATYECSDDSGELWGDFANHNGRRAIGATSPVANQRDCVITVDGKASVRWLTGYRPEGRQGELVGLTTSADALRPIVRTTGTTGTGDGARSLLHYILERHDTSLVEIADLRCGDYRRDTISHRRCVDNTIRYKVHGIDDRYTAPGSILENELTRCLVNHMENYCRWRRDREDGTRNCDSGAPMAENLTLNNFGPRSALLYHGQGQYGQFNEESGFHCRDLAEEHLATFGIEVHYCDDDDPSLRRGASECYSPNEYRLAPSE